MTVFYNKQKSVHGSMSGSIISYPVRVEDDQILNKQNLPEGYLRCDGSVLFATEYPELALVLGVGSSCRFKKEDQTLLDNQFQLPDLRMKHIRATTSANIGVYNDLYGIDNEGEKTIKSGVALTVQQNVSSPYEVQYTGKFFIPEQEQFISGEPRFTVETGGRLAYSEVDERGFQPHMHRTTTTRVRQIPEEGVSQTFNTTTRNSAKTYSSLNVCDWHANTAQELCNVAWAGYTYRNTDEDRRYDDVQYDGSTRYTQWGFCTGGRCDSFTTNGYCLWPEVGDYCDTFSNQNYRFFRREDGCNVGSVSSSTTYGNVTVEPTIYIKCKCTLAILSECVGMFGGQSPNNVNSEVLQNYGPAYSNTYKGSSKALPFGTKQPQVYQQGFAAVENITSRTGREGTTNNHTHVLPFNSDEPHTFVAKTRPIFIQAINTLTSTVRITKNDSSKADKYIQPYIVTEYLIKI